MAMNQLGNGLYANEDALSVREAELSMVRRLGAPEENILAAQDNLAGTYGALGRLEEALPLRRDVYSGHLKHNGEEHVETLVAATCYVSTLNELHRFEEAKSLLRESMPVAQRILGAGDDNTLRMRWNYADTLYKDDEATLDDLREAVTTLTEIERTARRVLGGTHPTTTGIEDDLRVARAELRARETPSSSPGA